MHVIPDKRLPFDDKSYDVVITSYVAHGLKPEERIKLYKEMRRLAKKFVIIYDYNENRAPLTTILEWLENGGYFNFIKIAQKEMKQVFENIKKINVDTRAAWYICNLND
jgi:ubiquinone/menaquinone biosynthesis C-methylase UbiE